MEFEFPSYYNMPPFFTIQPVAATRKKQSELWGDLILNYCKHNKLYELNIADMLNSPLFFNEAINRKLPPEGIILMIDELVKTKNAEWSNPKEKTKCSIFWKNIDHWADLIYNWAAGAGKTDMVLTVWEIQNGDDSEGQEFFGLETKILLKALRALEAQGKAEVFSGTSDENLGVKFFTV